MKDDLDGAKKAREDADNIRKDVEAKLAGVSVKTKEILDQATRDAEVLRQKLKSEAEADAGKIRDKTMAELGEEKSQAGARAPQGSGRPLHTGRRAPGAQVHRRRGPEIP